MKPSLYSSLLFLSFLLFPADPGRAFFENDETLIVYPGEEISRSGEIYKSVSIHVKPGGIINVHPDGIEGSIGKLNLIAPEIIIGGTITAVGISLNVLGRGGSREGSFGTGGGGAGYGGDGGIGAGSPGSGGTAYDFNLEDVGSYGYGTDLWPDGHSGYGGGCIRLDAISLTICADAQLLAMGYTEKADRIGGGSGGCIFLNGIYTMLESNSTLNVSGGDGGGSLDNVGPAGGGGSGRIKLVIHPIYTNLGANLIYQGGLSGGGTAMPGGGLAPDPIFTPTPVPSQLISPSDSADVSILPSFSFFTTDPANSKFLKYKLELDLDGSFTSVSITCSQMEPDAGWKGKLHYYSGVTATYQMQSDLKAEQTYYWRISVTNNEGTDWVPSSETRQFTTISNIKPDISLLHPSHDQTNVSITPDFRIWGNDEDGDSLTFTLTLSQNSDLTSAQTFESSYPGWDQSAYIPPGTSAGITATCQILNTGSNQDALTAGTDYYWQVIVHDQHQSTTSEIFHFTTSITPPSTPQLIFPENNYQAPDSRITFRFRAVGISGNTVNGCVQLSRNNFQDIWHTFDQTQDQAGWSETSHESGHIASFTLPADIQLERDKSYWWRAYSIEGEIWSAVSETRTFSLADSLEFQNVRIVPNPAVSTSSVQIYVQLSVDAKTTIRFYNKLGRELDKLHAQALGGAQGNIINYDISKYACGIYFYVIEAESSYGTEKITKQFAVVD